MLNKHTINITNEDHRAWFVDKYIHNWLNNNKPEIEQQANDKFDIILKEYETEQVSKSVSEEVNTHSDGAN